MRPESNQSQLKEYEIKLDLGNQRNYARLINALGVSSVEIEQGNYFFDTSDNQLISSKWAFRVRTSDEVVDGQSERKTRAEITLKGPQEVAVGFDPRSLSIRFEINAEIPASIATAAIAGGFDLTSLGVEPVIEVRKLIGDKKLIPLVSFCNRRLVFSPPFECGCLFEIDLTTFGDDSSRYELEMEFPEPKMEDIDRACDYVKELFDELEIAYLPQPVSKFAEALQKRLYST